MANIQIGYGEDLNNDPSVDGTIQIADTLGSALQIMNCKFDSWITDFVDLKSNFSLF